jgi:hypothetical protein
MRRICDVLPTLAALPRRCQYRKAIGRMFRLSNLEHIKSGAFKARKAIPAAVRAAYQRLYGRGWEVIFTLPAAHPRA